MKPITTVDDAVPEHSLGWEMLAWASDYLIVPDGPEVGNPLTFTAEQVRFLLRWYAVDPRGRFTYRRGVLRRMKGHGKDPVGVALALFELCGPCRFDGWGAEGQPVGSPHPMPVIQIAAVSLAQSKATMELIPAMLAPAGFDEYGVEAGFEIVRVATGGKIEAVTSSPRALEGARPTFAILNETEHWLRANLGHDMARVISRNLAKARDGSSRSLELANAHLVGEDSVAEQTFNAWEKRKGKVAGLLYDSLEAPAVDLTDPDAVGEAVDIARGDSSWIDVDRIVAEIMDPATRPSEARRFYLNQLVGIGDEEGWLPPGSWDACKKRGHVPEGTRVVLGFDGSTNRDSTALVVVTCEDKAHVDVVDLWECPPGSSDWRVPVPDVLETIRDACKHWKVVEIAADKSRWVAELEGLDDEGLPIVDFSQKANTMVPAIQRAYEAITTGSLTQSGDSRLARHIHNAVRKPTGHLSKVSKHSPRKIDLAVAFVMAFERAAHNVSASEYVWNLNLMVPQIYERMYREAQAQGPGQRSVSIMDAPSRQFERRRPAAPNEWAMPTEQAPSLPNYNPEWP